MTLDRERRAARRMAFFLIGVLLCAEAAAIVALALAMSAAPPRIWAAGTAATGRDPDRAIDVVFVADPGSYDVRQASGRVEFLADMELVIESGMYTNAVISANRGLFSWWYDRDPGPDAVALCEGKGTGAWRRPEVPFQPDGTLVLHRHRNMRDCASLASRVATAEVFEPEVAVHELSHVAFHMPDEYCCNGWYWHAPPILCRSKGPGVSAPDSCLKFAMAQSGKTEAEVMSELESIHSAGVDWLRSEQGNDIMVMEPTSDVLQYGYADWAFLAERLDGLDPGPLVAPAIFAPTATPKGSDVQ